MPLAPAQQPAASRQLAQRLQPLPPAHQHQPLTPLVNLVLWLICGTGWIIGWSSGAPNGSCCCWCPVHLCVKRRTVTHHSPALRARSLYRASHLHFCYTYAAGPHVLESSTFRAAFMDEGAARLGPFDAHALERSALDRGYCIGYMQPISAMYLATRYIVGRCAAVQQPCAAADTL